VRVEDMKGRGRRGSREAWHQSTGELSLFELEEARAEQWEPAHSVQLEADTKHSPAVTLSLILLFLPVAVPGSNSKPDAKSNREVNRLAEALSGKVSHRTFP